jgi:hypothetical protein
MASCLVAIDRATAENGCLQVIKGSHHMGRIDHGKAGEQTGADLKRVQKHSSIWSWSSVRWNRALRSSSTAIYFIALTRKRAQIHGWSLICSYNAARNPCREKVESP